MEDLFGFCKLCGKRYQKYRPNQKYCSNKCRHKAYKTKYRYIKNKEVTKICPNCKQEFTTNIVSKKYCSKECQLEHKPLMYKSKEKRVVVCEMCGEKFETGHQHKKYCSKECYNKAALKRRETEYKNEK